VLHNNERIKQGRERQGREEAICPPWREGVIASEGDSIQFYAGYVEKTRTDRRDQKLQERFLQEHKLLLRCIFSGDLDS
jgi:hypothetical protein